MTRKRMVINEVIKYFEDIRKEYPDITDDMLDTNGAIHYRMAMMVQTLTGQ